MSAWPMSPDCRTGFNPSRDDHGLAHLIADAATGEILFQSLQG